MEQRLDILATVCVWRKTRHHHPHLLLGSIPPVKRRLNEAQVRVRTRSGLILTRSLRGPKLQQAWRDNGPNHKGETRQERTRPPPFRRPDSAVKDLSNGPQPSQTDRRSWGRICRRAWQDPQIQGAQKTGGCYCRWKCFNVTLTKALCP